VTPERWQEVKKVLAEALERAPNERQAYLEQTCADPALRREVESLILQHEQSGGSFLAHPAFQTSAFQISPSQINALAIGSRLGPYEILAKIGMGGMGVVYRARDGRLERDVAIKVLSTGLLTDESARRRFRKEALALAKLNHANIAAIYDVGEQDTVDYLVMECISGQSLAEKVKSGPLPEKEIASSGGQIAAALEEAHEHGVVHRDLKPANVMVTPKGQAKVLDFGLAKLLLPFDAATTQSIGESKALAGTLPYMAPEQLQGEPVDGRTDIHALGLLLFEMACGRRLFQQESVPQLTDAILHQQPVTPRAFNALVSPELERIILKCLEKDPGNRYQSAKELGVDLRRLGTSSTVASHPTPAPFPVAPSSVVPSAVPATRRLRWPILAGALVAAAAIAGAYFYFHRAPQLTEKDSIVLADFANTTGDPVFDGTLRQGLSVQLQQTPYLQLVSDQQVGQTLQLMEKPLDTRLTPAVAREVCQRANATTDVEGSIAALGNQYVLGLNAVNCGSGETLAAEQVTADGKEKVLAALTTAASELRSKLGESSASLRRFDAPLEQVTTPSLEALHALSLANQAIMDEDFTSAASSLQRALSLDPNFAVAYSALGAVYTGMGDETLSIENSRKGYELRGRASDRERFSIESYYDAVVTGNLEKGTEVAEQWVRLFPRDLPALSTLNVAYNSSGRLNEALTTAREMVRLEPTAFTYRALAMANTSLGRFDEASATIQEAEAKHADPSAYRDVRYTIAFLQNNQEEMKRQSAGVWQGPYLKPGLLMYTAAYSGDLSQARELERELISSATQRGERGVIPSVEAASAVFEALSGNFVQAKNDIRNAGDLSQNPNFDVVGEAAMATALSGDTAQAQKFADDLNKRFPEATVVQFGYLPAVRGLLAARRGNGQEASEDLSPLSSHEHVIPSDWVGPYMTPVYLRGEAHLALHQGAEAATDFQMIMASADIIVNCPIGALAHLGLGRAYAMQGDNAKAKAEYQTFLALWNGADPDIPVLIAAKSEYAKLQ
jgi:serine/threonine protein kinase/tetratricopeptide (TPR) repeat protein